MEVDDNALARVDAELGRFVGRRGRVVLERWGRTCPPLACAGLDSPRKLPRWVWSASARDADAVLRMLVERAQVGEAVALVAVLACLRPGISTLVTRTGLSVDEAVSEVAFGVLQFPVARRATVAGQLLLDARKAVDRRRASQRDIFDGETRVALELVEAPGELGVELSVPEQWFKTVIEAWHAGDVRADDARLILETRAVGHAMGVAAARRGLARMAAYKRRARAEARIAAAGIG